MERERLDVILVRKGFFKSREMAKRAIMRGDVYINNQRVDKAGYFLRGDEEIYVKEHPKYVSRGGEKLERALKAFDIDIAGKVCLDCGASTGGFTDCLLKNGALKVVAVDVGYGQFDWGLRNSSRVRLIERKNIKDLKPEELEERPEVIVADVSFISIDKIWKRLKEIGKENCEYIFLIKPQFEVGKDRVEKKGIIKDKRLHKEVLLKYVNLFETEDYVADLDYSPIRGAKGNIEYLLHIKKDERYHRINENDIDRVIEEAFESL